MSVKNSGLLLEEVAQKMFQTSPLIQCMTNEVTCESMANALLYVGSKPMMADDIREFPEMFKQIDGLLLNLGHMSKEREESLLLASQFAKEFHVPFVIDVVGVSATRLRLDLALKLMESRPSVVKGNTSEMRRLCGLASRGRGVDAHESDQGDSALQELAKGLVELGQTYPNTLFLVTGETDILVYQDRIHYLKNGVAELDNMTGTGDMVGALIASLLAQGFTPLESSIGAVSYFNLAGETGKNLCQSPVGMADFRYQLMNQLSLLYKRNYWWEGIISE